MRTRWMLALVWMGLVSTASADEEASKFVGRVDLPHVRARLEFSGRQEFVLRVEHPQPAVYATNGEVAGLSRRFELVGRKTIGSQGDRYSVLEYRAVGLAHDRIRIRTEFSGDESDLLAWHEIDRVPFCVVSIENGCELEIPFNREGAPASRNFRSTALVRARSGRVWGYRDPRSGRFVIPPRFRIARQFRHGRAAVQVNGRFGFIDRKGKLVIPAQYDRCSDFGTHGEPGLAMVVRQRRHGMVDRNGGVVLPMRYGEFPAAFVNGVMPMRLMDGWMEGRALGLIDRTGRVIAEPRFSSVGSFSEGRIVVTQLNGSHFMRLPQTGYLDRKGKIAIPFDYRVGRAFREGLAPVRLLSNKWVFIDRDGRTRIPGPFDYADEFWNGLAVVGVGKMDNNSPRFQGQYGCVSRAGKLVIPAEFDWIEGFQRGERSIATRKGVKGWLYKDGRFEPQRER
ncbi:MAG: WG repeat-containing protein [Planctomycetota bacterium]